MNGKNMIHSNIFIKTDISSSIITVCGCGWDASNLWDSSNWLDKFVNETLELPHLNLNLNLNLSIIIIYKLKKVVKGLD